MNRDIEQQIFFLNMPPLDEREMTVKTAKNLAEKDGRDPYMDCYSMGFMECQCMAADTIAKFMPLQRVESIVLLDGTEIDFTCLRQIYFLPVNGKKEVIVFDMEGKKIKSYNKKYLLSIKYA